MSAPRAILHIGAEKTGSTARQQSLAAHRAELWKHGFVYSSAAGTVDHVRLVGFSEARGVTRRELGIDDVPAFCAGLTEALSAEIEAAPTAIFVFSTELCHGRLRSQEDVDRLAALLHSLFDDITIVLYLRRQDALAVSKRSTLLKAGRTDPPFFPDTPYSRVFYDFWSLSQRWEKAFGREAMKVRRFAAGAGAGAAIVSDFCMATGLPSLPEAAQRANESLRPVWQELLGGINARIPHRVDGSVNPDRGEFDQLIQQLGAGRGLRPSRRDARAFLRRFEDSNERVRARYFPELETLFDRDFSDYPLAGDPVEASREDLLDAVAELWRAAARRK